MKIFTGPRKKKADLSLSVNTIVIVVLAITLLGLGLTFIRSIVGKAFEKVEGQIDVTDLDAKPTSQNPLTINDPVEVRANGLNENVKIGFYNKAGTVLKDVKPKIESCISLDPDVTLGATTPALTTVSKKELGASESVGFLGSIKDSGYVADQTYICTLTVETTTADVSIPSKDFKLKVVS